MYAIRSYYEILYKGRSENPAFKQEAGIQFQSTALMDYLTVREVLQLFASFYQRHVPLQQLVITSYSIHYTKLYELPWRGRGYPFPACRRIHR